MRVSLEIQGRVDAIRVNPDNRTVVLILRGNVRVPVRSNLLLETLVEWWVSTVLNPEKT